MSDVHPLRLAVKALLFFTVINLLFALMAPPVGRLSIFNRLVPGRLRFNAERNSDDPSSAGILAFDDLDAMFASHVISKGLKPADEYRIILLGDSAVWGFEVTPQETLSEQLNSLGLQTCDGRKVRAYNLAYPLPSNTRDLITLEKALEFQPDLVIWMVTLKTFNSTTAEKYLLIPQSERVLDLIARYHIKVDAERFLHPPSFWDETIAGSSVRLKKIMLEQLYGLLWAATGFDVRLPDPATAAPLSENVEASSNYNDFSVSDQQTFIEKLDFMPIAIARDLAGNTPVMIVNEPVFRAHGENGDLRYNKYYPRWAYDLYRPLLMNWMQKDSGIYVDLWSSIPNDEFIGSPLHLNSSGEMVLARDLIPQIQRVSCSK